MTHDTLYARDKWGDQLSVIFWPSKGEVDFDVISDSGDLVFTLAEARKLAEAIIAKCDKIEAEAG